MPFVSDTYRSSLRRYMMPPHNLVSSIKQSSRNTSRNNLEMKSCKYNPEKSRMRPSTGILLFIHVTSRTWPSLISPGGNRGRIVLRRWERASWSWWRTLSWWRRSVWLYVRAKTADQRGAGSVICLGRYCWMGSLPQVLRKMTPSACDFLGEGQSRTILLAVEKGSLPCICG